MREFADWMHPVEVWGETETLDEFGRPTRQFTYKKTVRGVIDALDGDEIEKMSRLVEDATHILVTGDRDIHRGEVVKFRGKMFDVKYVDNPLYADENVEILLKMRDQ